MTMKLPKKATTVPSKRVWNSGLRVLKIINELIESCKKKNESFCGQSGLRAVGSEWAISFRFWCAMAATADFFRSSPAGGKAS